MKWIINKTNKKQCLDYINEIKTDEKYTVEVKKLSRSDMQNNTEFMWYKEIALAKGDENPTDIRAYCKLHFGVPILREDNEEFRIAYDKAVKPLTYDKKLLVMVEPLDFPVTRIMTTDQMQRYMDCIQEFGYSVNAELTIPI